MDHRNTDAKYVKKNSETVWAIWNVILLMQRGDFCNLKQNTTYLTSE
jgi:hypothetical protein